MQKLKNPGTQNVEDRRVQFFERNFRKVPDDVVDAPSPPQDPEHQSIEELAVPGVRQDAALIHLFQQGIQGSAAMLQLA
jgi:hypothetical protein